MTRSARAFLVLAFMAAPALAQQPQQRPTGDTDPAAGAGSVACRALGRLLSHRWSCRHEGERQERTG